MNMLQFRGPNTVSGILQFSPKKILLLSGATEYYVRLPRQHGYLHGDRVQAKITKKGDGVFLPEVRVLGRQGWTQESILAKVIVQKGKRGLQVLREFGYYRTFSLLIPNDANVGDVFLIRFSHEGIPRILRKFTNLHDFDADEQILFFLAKIDTSFPDTVGSEAQKIKNEAENTLRYAKNRRDLRKEYIFTIDGADAKDLDDAISIKKLEYGYELGVHIADVAEYVREGSSLDREALHRATSVYTPGKVIPMLPHELSNDLCSLHPGSPKLTLSIVMQLDEKGNVTKREVFESIIESKHRGVYEEIYTLWKTRNPSRPELSELLPYVDTAFSLYAILVERRKKEGKILFDTTEVSFGFSDPNKRDIPDTVNKRTRNEAHMLIEEFMVLANEEVAKWCYEQHLPFLSRIHARPSEIARQTLSHIVPTIGSSHEHEISPQEIRVFLDSLSEGERYRYSRLLLPKMSKAYYSDAPLYHFGLALDFYTHFTSPIRRYPDLQVHRIIKEKLRNTLSQNRELHYQRSLKKVARLCSERERNAEDVERTMDALYASRYMSQHVGEVFSGRVSGISEFAYFVELDIGIEVTVTLSRGRCYVDPITGILFTAKKKRLVMIGEALEVRITEVSSDIRKVFAERTGLSFGQSSPFS